MIPESVSRRVRAHLGGLRETAKLVLRSRLMVLLILGVLAVNVGIVLTRTGSLAQIPPTVDNRSPLVLLEELTVETLVRYRSGIDLAAHGSLREGMEAVLFGDRTGRRSLTFTTTSLDSLYVLLIPILALLVGGNLLPYNEKVYGSVFSLPVRRSSFFLYHLVILLGGVIILFAALFAIDVGLGAVLYGADELPLLKLLHFNILGAVWALFFAVLGLFLGAFRRRSAALVVGLILLVLSATVLPAANSALMHAYRNSISLETLMSIAGGEQPVPLAMRVLKWTQYTPGIAFNYATTDLADRDFKTGSSSGSYGSVPQEEPLGRILGRYYLSLLVHAAVLGMLGMGVFQKRRTVS